MQNGNEIQEPALRTGRCGRVSLGEPMCIKGRKSQALGLDVGSNPSLTSFCLDKCSNFFIYLFYFWLCWVFVAILRLSLAAASGSSLR